MRKIIEKDKLQITFLDERFYKIGDIYLPSVTTVLDVYPKGYGFVQWLKDVGHNAKVIVEKAADEGRYVHDCLEKLVTEGTVDWNYEKYGLPVWKMVLKGKEFLEKVTPLVVEKLLININKGYAGTADLICEINGEKWLIDYKTGNAIYKTHWLQLAAYAKATEGIDRVGILHLKAATRGPDKTGKSIQGKGWRLMEPPKPIEDYFKLFEHCMAIYKEENPLCKPKDEVFPIGINYERTVTS